MNEFPRGENNISPTEQQSDVKMIIQIPTGLPVFL